MVKELLKKQMEIDTRGIGVKIKFMGFFIFIIYLQKYIYKISIHTDFIYISYGKFTRKNGDVYEGEWDYNKI